MSEPSEDPAARARKYIKALTNALQNTGIRADATSVTKSDIQRVVDATYRYLRDAEHYLNEQRPSTSLASVAYAEGLLDALVFLGLASAEISP